MQALIYKGCVLQETEAETPIHRKVFGTWRKVTVRCWRITGRLHRPAERVPLMLSAAECKKWVKLVDQETQAHGELSNLR